MGFPANEELDNMFKEVAGHSLDVDVKGKDLVDRPAHKISSLV